MMAAKTRGNVIMARSKDSCIPQLTSLGISLDDAQALRRISMTLHRWHELECGVDGGGIDRGDDGKPRWYNSHTGKLSTWVMPDREKGALARLTKIMARYPTLTSYVQGDPRGCALYILRPGDVPEGANADAYYSRGIPVYK